LELGN
jgi:hypothetical protein